MSMISGQVDRLRTAAQTYRRLGNHSAESMLIDAADTIWELRDDLQRANADVRDAEHEESRAWDRVRKAEADNAKLRELVQDYEHCSMHADCGRCEYDGTASTHCPLSPCFPDIDELRELGVEVSE